MNSILIVAQAVSLDAFQAFGIVTTFLTARPDWFVILLG
jgi:hypothetical protein